MAFVFRGYLFEIPVHDVLENLFSVLNPCVCQLKLYIGLVFRLVNQ